MELRIRQLHLTFFGHEKCLHAIDLSATDGLTVLYGETGSGKTALLKCVAGINAYEGEITLDDVPIRYGKDGDVGMVFDDLALFHRRSLWYNLTYPLRIRKVPKAEWESLLAPVRKDWGLEKVIWENATFRTSESIRVRVALARAMLTPRKVLLLDNPLCRLTPDERRQVFRMLAARLRQYPGVVVYSTDDVEEARALRAPMAVLSGGYLLAHDTPEAMAAALPCVYVAKQLIPFWRTIEGVAEGRTVHTDEGDMTANVPEAYEGKRVLLGVAPAACHATEDADGAYTAYNTMPADGKRYTILTPHDCTTLGDYPIGTRLTIAFEGPMPVYDPATEWRVDERTDPTKGETV